ncbi:MULTISPECIES: hypothetical protein [Nonomuraea]|uniref:LppX_LprAFG lipoprotein n=1 Tax=Nonomuraea mangrovi TaxID=2316207 RepID=A0ABW4SRJ2_9ACTN
MRRVIAGLALTTGVALVTAVPAQAAARPDPVKALKAQISSGKGAEVTSSTTMSVKGKKLISFTEKGKIQPGKGSDLTFKGDLSLALFASIEPGDVHALSALAGTSRFVTIGKETYVSGELVRNALPTGMTWLRFEEPVTSPGAPLIDVLAPGTLKTLLAGAGPAKGGVVKGTTSVAGLRSVAPRLRAFATKGAISWTLTLDGKGLVKSFSATLPSTDGMSVKTGTRVSRWGSVKIAAPADGVYDADALGQAVPIPDPIAEANK